MHSLGESGDFLFTISGLFGEGNQKGHNRWVTKSNYKTQELAHKVGESIGGGCKDYCKDYEKFGGAVKCVRVVFAPRHVQCFAGLFKLNLIVFFQGMWKGNGQI